MSELGAIVKRLTEIVADQKRLEREHKMLWVRAFQIFDDKAGEGEPFRWLDVEQGQVIARSIVTQDILDEAKLQELLTPEQWKAITVVEPRLDNLLLEAALKTEFVKASAVREVTTQKKVARRLLYAATQEEQEEIAGLQRQLQA